jgi:hypothetical protein
MVGAGAHARYNASFSYNKQREIEREKYTQYTVRIVHIMHDGIIWLTRLVHYDSWLVLWLLKAK